ncbi:hypothetical protein CO731_01568 [Aminobacter sp. MSH1]|nr:hypothetical protein CO731_01568 [Aminobacter sp. MSH1]
MNRFAIIVALSLCGLQAAYAADTVLGLPEEPAPDVTERPLRALQITPYMWAAGLDGSISPFQRGPTMHVEKSFSDVMDDLNFGGFVNVWGRYDRFVFSGDLMYVDTSDGHGTGPLPAMQIPGLGVAIPPGASVDAKVDSKQFMATLQGGYRVIDTPQFTLDALGGIRFWHISNDVTVTASHALIGSRSASHGESFGWVDPVVGLRAFLPVTDKLSLQAQADIGGFGAGSEFTWSVLGTANYIVTDRFSVSAGYKVLDVDYERGGHVYDTRLSGPVLGTTWRF